MRLENTRNGRWGMTFGLLVVCGLISCSRAKPAEQAPANTPPEQAPAKAADAKTPDAGALASTQPWAFWRGPQQNGVSTDKNLPAKFSLDPKDPDSNLV